MSGSTIHLACIPRNPTQCPDQWQEERDRKVKGGRGGGIFGEWDIYGTYCRLTHTHTHTELLTFNK